MSSPRDLLVPADTFPRRHHGADTAEVAGMLSLLGFASTDALVDAAVPPHIRRGTLQLPAAASESTALAELRAIAEEAHMWGLKVAAHAHGAAGIRAAIRAGIDTIEHASLIDDEGIRLAKERGAWLAMDIFNTDYTQAEGAKNGVLEDNLRKDREVAQIQRDNFRKAHKAGVTILAGTDTPEPFVTPGFSLHQELEMLVESGLSAGAALQAATINNARIVRQGDKLGRIEPGMAADLVILSADPTEAIRHTRKIEQVIHAGRLISPAELLKPFQP